MIKPQGEDNISVYLRIRPFNDKQVNTQTIVQSLSQKTIKVKDKESESEFAFDGVFNEKSTQQQVYEKVGKDVVQGAFEGFNGTIFAYGQTSSGKTHTCIGPDYNDDKKKGILPRIVSHMFSRISEQPPYIEFRIKISMVEIYLQKIKDLLDVSKTDVKIRQNKSKGIYLQDITQEYVASTGQAIQFFEKGITNRTVAQTNMNDVSSRSHMAFIITLYQNNLKDASAKSGKIILVDLAGSEKVSKTGAEGKLLDQAKQINKSLSALGNVINALTDSKISHIPYRDSKLTRLLQESLGGNSKTRLIINVSPSLYNYSESLSSLRFGFRAKQIKNKPRVNREYTVAELLILLQKAQKRIEELEKLLSELTTSKKKNSSIIKAPAFIENLLDSDNPIMSGLSQNEGEISPRNVFKKQLSGIKQNRFESEAPSEDQLELRTATKTSFSSGKKNIDFQKQSQEWARERNQLLETIHDLTFDKNEGYRQIQIFEEKYEIAAKQARLLSSKFNSVQKENQKLLQKVISSKLECQQKQIRIKGLERQVQSYEESIRQMMNSQNAKMSKVFGVGSKEGSESNKLIEKYQMFNETGKQQHDEQEMAKEQRQTESMDQLKRKILQLEGDLSMYKGLQETKERLVKEKLQFVAERQRVYKDLQNRIQKVCQLQERLDELKQLNKFLEETVNTQESQRGRKILNLQKHLDQLSESYYVLKGLQSSWINNNKRYEKKMSQKDQTISKLQHQIIQLKAEIQTLKMDNSHEDNEDFGGLDFQVDDDYNPFAKKQGKIVKVLKSSHIFV